MRKVVHFLGCPNLGAHVGKLILAVISGLAGLRPDFLWPDDLATRAAWHFLQVTHILSTGI